MAEGQREETMFRDDLLSDYHGIGWPHGDPFATRPMQVFEDIRKRYPETAIWATDDSAQSLGLIYPSQTTYDLSRGYHECHQTF